MLKTKNTTRPIEILLVEDDADQAEVTMDTLAEGRVHNRVSWVQDGEEALAVLRREGAAARTPRPDLILLDLHMPRMGGLEVLAEIKTHPQWRQIPVVILTTSTAEKDILAAYDRHANCYITKPDDLAQLTEAVRSIEDFWLGVVHLPAA
jgi:chemotaxis family two-component system response regulator Rcp1